MKISPIKLAELAVRARVEQKYIDAFLADINSSTEGQPKYRNAMKHLAREALAKSEALRQILKDAGLL